MGRPKPHPDPPAELPTVGLPMTKRSRQWFRAHRWSRALWLHPQKPDGILYLARHNPAIVCAAVFDRAPVAAAEKLGPLLGPRLVPQTAALLDAYGVGLC